MLRDLYNNLKVSQLTAPVVKTASFDSGSVDNQGYDSLALVLQFGVAGDTLSGSVKMTPALEESDNDSVFTAVAADDIEGSFSVVDADGKANQAYKVGYKGNKRYVRVAVTFAGSHSTGTPMAVFAVQSKAHQAPVA